MIEFKPLGTNRSKITMSITFTPKMVFIGRLILPMMRKLLSKSLADLLTSNKSHVEIAALAAA